MKRSVNLFRSVKFWIGVVLGTGIGSVGLWLIQVMAAGFAAR